MLNSTVLVMLHETHHWCVFPSRQGHLSRSEEEENTSDNCYTQQHLKCTWIFILMFCSYSFFILVFILSVIVVQNNKLQPYHSLIEEFWRAEVASLTLALNDHNNLDGWENSNISSCGALDTQETDLLTGPSTSVTLQRPVASLKTINTWHLFIDSSLLFFLSMFLCNVRCDDTNHLFCNQLRASERAENRMRSMTGLFHLSLIPL